MYVPNTERYAAMAYRRCGKSGLKLPEVSLGLWHNFGDTNTLEHMEAICKAAFDGGITHFDLANNYGPPAGAAEQNFGKILKTLFAGYRDELIISTKAGFDMWEGPYGNWGSRKYLLASLDQSLKRMGLEYVDIFYHHRPDPDTPLEETCDALSQIVRQGKALYIGLSNYRPAEAKRACALLRQNRTPCVVMQPNYSMFDRWIEDGLLRTLEEEGAGAVVFKPLEQGLLTGKYLHGIPADSRIRRDPRFLKEGDLNPSLERKIGALAAVAVDRGQSMAQMALAWTLRDPRVTSAIIGASRASQITENIGALQRLTFTEDELRRIDAILKED